MNTATIMNQQRTRVIIVLLFGLLLSPAAVHAGHRLPVGGGTTRAGLDGEYYANPDFAGKPAFTRRDVRINFDWKEGVAGRGLPVGGATTPGMADFPHDDFSIRWTGQIVARFQETYTFHVTGKDGVRFTLGGKVLVDSLGKSVDAVVTHRMPKGVKISIVFEYVDRAGTGASQAKLEWSSPSTPREVIEPLSFAQACLHQAKPAMWNALEMANAVRLPCGPGFIVNNKPMTAEQMDKNGWPNVANFDLKVSHYGDTDAGRYKFVFTGKAGVSLGGGQNLKGTWYLSENGEGESFKTTLPKGKGYDAEANTTTAWFVADTQGMMIPKFSGAEYAPGKPGIRNLQIYVPVANGSMEHHQPGEIYTRQARDFFKNFVLLRSHIGTSLNKGWTWEQRSLPSYYRRDHADGWAYCLEELIMAANDVGKDFHICCGAGWDQDFMEKFAQLVRYGSDGVNPYDHYVENPKYPPLNPNLRIYLEHSNELPWAVYPSFIWGDLEKKYKENHPDIAVINYDGKNPSYSRGNHGAMFRYHALRMKQISDAFRKVYSDVPDAIGDRARVFVFGQYDASHMANMLQFIDNYFGMADPKSTYRGEPHPPSYYFWGGGGAIYYGCENKFGFMAKELITDNSFEETDIPDGKAVARPEGSVWSFTGNGGIIDTRVHSPALKVVGMPAQPAAEPEQDQWVGCRFTVGDKDVYVHQLGRWIGKDRAPNVWASGKFAVTVFDSEGRDLMRRGTANKRRLSEFPSGRFGYEYCAISAWQENKIMPFRLEAGKTYYLVSRESSRKHPERYYGPVKVESEAGSGITVKAAVAGTDGKKWQETTGSLCYGPLNLTVASEIPATADGVVGMPRDYTESIKLHSWAVEAGPDKVAHQKVLKPKFEFGTQCAFLQGESKMSREFDVTADGAYWFTFNCAAEGMVTGRKGQRTLRVLVDGKDVTTGVLLPNSGYSASPYTMHFSSSNVFKLKPGKHTVTFERVNPGKSTVFIDTVRLSNELAFYGGPKATNFPAGGGALGQSAEKSYLRTARMECEMAQNWGLVPCTYEGGWAVQRDFDRYNMNAWNDLRYGSKATNPEFAKQALRNAFNIWTKHGGYIYAYFYPVMRDIDHVDAPLYKCVQEMNDELTAEPTVGARLPGILTPKTDHAQGGIGGYRSSISTSKAPSELPARSWKSWIVHSNKTAEYSITLSASGGPCELVVDGETVATGKAEELKAKVKLTAGAHSIRVDAGENPLKIEKITVGK